jgi:hypothetical protein
MNDSASSSRKAFCPVSLFFQIRYLSHAPLGTTQWWWVCWSDHNLNWDTLICGDSYNWWRQLDFGISVGINCIMITMVAIPLLRKRFSLEYGGQVFTQSNANTVLSQIALAMLTAGLPVALSGIILAASSRIVALSSISHTRDARTLPSPNIMQDAWINILVSYSQCLVTDSELITPPT